MVAVGHVVGLDRVDPDGGFTTEGALMLTDATASATLRDDLRLEHGGPVAFRVGDGGLFQLDSLLRQGAHLLADDAVLLVGPGDAPISVDLGLSDDRLTLLFQ